MNGPWQLEEETMCNFPAAPSSIVAEALFSLAFNTNTAPQSFYNTYLYGPILGTPDCTHSTPISNLISIVTAL